MRSVTYFLIVIVISFAGCAVDDLSSFDKEELSLNDFYNFLGMTGDEFSERFPLYAPTPHNSVEQMNTYLEGDKHHHELDLNLQFKKDTCYNISFTEISEKQEFKRYIMLGNLLNNEISEPETVHIFFKRNGEHELSKLYNVRDLGIWLNREPQKKEIELRSVALTFRHPNTEQNILFCLNYTVNKTGCNYGLVVLEDLSFE